MGTLLLWLFAASSAVAALACGSRAQPSDGDIGPTGSDAGGGDAAADAARPCASPDHDGDGFDRPECGGLDCNDEDPSVNQEAPDAALGLPWTFARLEGARQVARFEVSMDGEGVAHLLADVGPPDGAHSLEHGVIGAGAIAWAPQLVAEGRVDAFAVVAGGGDLHALYGSGGQVFYTRESTGWSGATIDTGDVESAAILVDPEGTVHALYQGGPLARQVVHAVRLEDGAWTAETLDGIDGTAGAFSPEGDLIVAYPSEGDLYVARSHGGAWSAELVDDVEETGSAPSVGIDDEGRIFVAYGQYTRGDLKVATGWEGSWTVETVDENGRVGWQSSIAFGPSGEPVIAYSALFEGSVRLARHAPDGWTYGRLDTPVRGLSARAVFFPTGALLVGFVDMDGHLWVALQGRDGVDQNCDGIDGVDVDGDGHATTGTGGDDCFDDDPEAWACGES